MTGYCDKVLNLVRFSAPNYFPKKKIIIAKDATCDIIIGTISII